MSKKREIQLLPAGVPRYIRCYDNGGTTADRFTCVFTGRYAKQHGEFVYLTACERPYHPQGIGQHGSAEVQIDRPSSKRLGKRVAFSALPMDVQKFIISTYSAIWGI